MKQIKTENEVIPKQKSRIHDITVGGKIPPELKPKLDRRIKADGFNSVGEFLRAYASFQYPRASALAERNNQFLDWLLKQELKNPITGEVTTSPHKLMSPDELYIELLNTNHFKSDHPKHLRNYYAKHADLFFSDPKILKGFTPHKISWINDAMRRFGERWNEKYQDPSTLRVIDEIIKRYGLDVNPKDRDSILMGKESDIKRQLAILLKPLDGDDQVNTVLNALTLTGIRFTEIMYMHKTPICDQALCKCQGNIHVDNFKNGISVIMLNWFRGRKKVYFTYLPTEFWRAFRKVEKINAETQRTIGEIINGVAGIKGGAMQLRKYAWNTFYYGIDMLGAETLTGHASSVAARNYFIRMQDKLPDMYIDAWRKMDVDILSIKR